MDTLSLDKLALNDLDKLFNHKGFRLIFIDDDGSMSLEGPFDGKTVQYRCISHVWGTADKTKDHVWKDHPIKGVAWKVEVREEKRDCYKSFLITKVISGWISFVQTRMMITNHWM
jgi:hypothetical protein